MNTLFTVFFGITLAFEVIVLVAMLLSILNTFEPLLTVFLDNARDMTKLGILTQWLVASVFITMLWYFSGLSIGWLALSFGLDLVTVPTVLWLRKLARYNPVASEMLAG